jgi:DNA-binding NarL/FixJ family response regulator
MGETSAMPPPPGTAPPELLRVLIADDDRLFARMLRARLSAVADIEVVGLAANGRQAMALAEELKPDVVLMDVKMPVMDGVEATRLIRALENPPSVVLITGEDEAADAAAYEAGAAAYLRKSTDLFRLVDVIVTFSQLARTSA